MHVWYKVIGRMATQQIHVEDLMPHSIKMRYHIRTSGVG